MRGLERQSAIYLGGVSGTRPRVPVDSSKLEERARDVLPENVFGYIAGGAGTDGTVDSNRRAFDRWRIVPRPLRDVSSTDPSVELYGRRIPSPYMLAPVGVLSLAHRDGERAAARGVRDDGVPFVFSNQASTAMEEIAEELGDSPRWFQLYWSTSDDLVESLVRRAERCGCEAIVVTVDNNILGWRPRDLEPAFLPFLRGAGIAQYTSDPVFRRIAEEQAAAGGETPTPKPTLAALRTLFDVAHAYPEPFWTALRSGRARAAVQTFIRIFSRPNLTWDDLPWLRERTRLPILLKGILHPDDARRAIDAGMDGIVVSNHGGRQVDGAIATFEALPAVAEAVGGRAPVLLDSGIRGGADAFKAVALGASAVLVGRPYVYGLAIAGEEGVREVIRNLAADFELTMALAGCTSVAEIGPDALVRTP